MINLGLDRIVMKGVENPAAYEYVVYVTVGHRRVQIMDYDHFNGETVLINKTVPLSFNEEDTIFISMLRRTSFTSRD